MVRQIKEIIGKYSGYDYTMIDSDMNLKDDLHLDDSEINEMLEELEDEFNIEFNDLINEFSYVVDIIAYVKEYF